MTCEERQRYWNERLDSGVGRSPSFEPEWDAHLDACERCRVVSAGFETLRETIEAWPSPMPASTASIAKLERLGAWYSWRLGRRFRAARAARIAVPLGLAASLAGIAWLDSPEGRTPDRGVHAPPPRPSARPVLVSLREARRATRELTREVSGSAARIGREILDLDATLAAEDDGQPPESRSPAAHPGRATEGPGHPGGRPIPESARHAFGFLLGPEGPPPSEIINGL